MQPKFEYRKDKILVYLEEIVDQKERFAEELSKNKRSSIFVWLESSIIFIWLKKIFNKNLSRNKRKSSVIKVPINFCKDIENSKFEIEEIEKHTDTLCSMAGNNEKELKLREDYLQLRLDAYTDRLPLLSYAFPFFVVLPPVVVGILILGSSLVPSANLINWALFVLAVLTYSAIVYKVFFGPGEFNSTLNYKYCLLLLQRAQEKAKEIKDDELLESSLLNQVEQGEEIVITRRGHPIAQLSSTHPKLRPLPSHAQLRASQPLAKTSSLEILRRLRDEARY